MSKRFRLYFGWGLFGACFGAALGVAICWAIGADPSYWPKTSIPLALVFATLGAFFGARTVALILEALSYLIF